jgi:hypothetical protein
MGISMFGGRLEGGAAVFLGDGSAWFGSGFPTHGLDGVKPHVERHVDPRRWGTYRFQGGTGEIEMPYGSIPLRLEGNVLVVTTGRTPHRFVRVHTPAGGRLDGRYCLADAAACLTLAPDGRFRDEGAVRILEHATYPYPASPAGGQGQYEIRDHTLVLRYDGGPEVRVAYPGTEAPGQSRDPPAISLGFNLDQLKRM